MGRHAMVRELFREMTPSERTILRMAYRRFRELEPRQNARLDCIELCHPVGTVTRGKRKR